MKSATVGGFFLFSYVDQLKKSFSYLAELYDDGKIKCSIDDGSRVKEGGFRGIDDIVDAVEYLYSRKSIGKIVVRLDDNPSSKL